MIINRKVTKYAGTEIISVTYLNLSWEYVRIKRDVALKNTDWRFMSDQSPSQEWIDYRQFLRNLPQNFTDSNEAADAWNEYQIPE